MQRKLRQRWLALADAVKSLTVEKEASLASHFHLLSTKSRRRKLPDSALSKVLGMRQ